MYRFSYKKNSQWYLNAHVVGFVAALCISSFPFVSHAKTFFTVSTQEIKGFVVEDEQVNHAWYVNPRTRERFFIEHPADLLPVVAMNMVGISEVNFSRALQNVAFARKFNGMLFLRVHHHGEVWYIDPGSGALSRLGRLDSFSAIQKLSKLVPQEALKQIRVSVKSPSWIGVPDGYTARISATGFQRPRVLAFDSSGHLFVSDLSEKGSISAFIDTDSDGVFDSKKIIVPNLYNPHGIAFTDNKLYVATEFALYSWFYSDKKVSVISPPTKVMALPAGGEKFAGQGHKTRTIINGNDGYLYLSIGSNCDHCVDGDERYASIQRINIQSGKHDAYARGLRNTVFFVKDLHTGDWWGNDMGQDNLGQDLPPDELNNLTLGGQYGWPYCYGNQISTQSNDDSKLCSETIGPKFTYSAHSAPLGLRFISEIFSREYKDDLLVALHGASVIDEMRGYKIARIDMLDGKPGMLYDFIGGFTRGQVILGRPTDLIFDAHGRRFITDDYASVIHEVERVR